MREIFFLTTETSKTLTTLPEHNRTSAACPPPLPAGLRSLSQVVTAETLMDPSESSENDQASPAREVSPGGCAFRALQGCGRRGPRACCFLARVSGWRMWTGTPSPIGTPTSSPTSSRTRITSDCTGPGLPLGPGEGGLASVVVGQSPCPTLSVPGQARWTLREPVR